MPLKRLEMAESDSDLSKAFRMGFSGNETPALMEYLCRFASLREALSSLCALVTFARY